eukprot:CAMPEP_0201596532 /NCGR_PEP_ID=MMETSP0190_2-20130828/193201_1 /ASSEMBLY_ACC=CAM_ASM_000263 /TAXON_ID=37353 /ORGANISM="Rosalina sp." /LENGTH=211 /DNA_ID=CAMNT_0048056941 /DNA_START=178 /DNA_END=816 /DNA_ORIENTATION=-
MISKCSSASSSSGGTSGYASGDKQLDAGAFGDYHRGVQQQTVKTIVDKQYNGSKAFDDDYDSDDEQTALQDNITVSNDRLQRMLENVMDKVDKLSEKSNNKSSKSSDSSTTKKRPTALQLQKKILQRKQEIEKQQQIQQSKHKEEESKENIMANELIMSTEEIRKSIRSSRNAIDIGDNLDNTDNDNDDAKIEEEDDDDANEQQRGVEEAP